MKEMDTFGVDILCLSETKKKGRMIENLNGMTCIYSGVNENEFGRAGVGVILSERVKECMYDYGYVNERIMWVRMKVNLQRVLVVAVYAPCDGASVEEKDYFYDSLRDELDKLGRMNEKIIIVGDLHECVGWM